MAILDNVRTMLGLSDTLQDDKLTIIISNTESRLLSLLPASETVVPERLHYIVEEVAIKRYNRIGAEGMTSESVEGRSNTFESNDFNEYLPVIARLYPTDEDSRGRVTFD